MKTPIHTRDERGFSLVEMLIVVATMGILLMILLPNVGISRFQADAAMRSIGTSLQTAQRTAVVRNHDIVVGIDDDARQLRIHFDEDNDGERDDGERVVNTPFIEGVVIGRSSAPARTDGEGIVTFTQIRAGLPSITYHRNGSASESGSLYLTTARAVADPARHPHDARVLEISRATGRANWHRYTAGGWKRDF